MIAPTLCAFHCYGYSQSVGGRSLLVEIRGVIKEGSEVGPRQLMGVEDLLII